MTLGELIKKYREEHDISQRQFATMCEVSNGYISMLERGVNPKTKQPVTPTIQMFQKISSVMGVTISELFSMVDDMPVGLSLPKKEISPSERTLTEGEEMMLELFRRIPEDRQAAALELLRAALKMQ